MVAAVTRTDCQKEGFTILVSKTRVHELSKELNINARELLSVLNQLGADVKNHMSLVDEQYVNQVRKMYAAGPPAVTVRPTITAVPASPSPASAASKSKTVEAKPETVRPKPAAKPKSSPPAPQGRSARPATGTDKKPDSPGGGAGAARQFPRRNSPAGNFPAARPASGPGKGQPRGRSPVASANGDRKNQRGREQGWRRGGGTGAGKRSGRPGTRGRQGHAQVKQPPLKRSIELPSVVSVKELAAAMAHPVGEIIKKLMSMGVMATINQEIDYDTAAIVAEDLGHEVRPAPSIEDKLRVEEVEDAPESLVSRPPVVCVMGHVDHGKTSLLDAVRETNVTAQEAGGITQHIGAYQVEVKNRRITFLDTPGHEAFTAMRARGAQVVDMAILVVAADDGVMPQTVEAINHAKAANTPVIVAVNKIDKPQANSERVKQELTEHGLVAEEWGGDTIIVEVSALKRTGLDHLLEMVLLLADMRDFKANPDRPAKGTILESQLDKGRGPVATVLVQNGTLELGDTIIAGAVAGRVRALTNDKGKRVRKAGPSTPVEVVGLDDLPVAGDELFAIKDDHLARQVADQRQQTLRESELHRQQPLTLDDLFNRVKEGELKDLKIIIKADVHGSVEALRQALERIANEQVRVLVIHGGVGAITKSDVMLASASNAIIIGFNVRPDADAERMAEKEQVDMRLYRVIYEAIENVQAALEGMLAPEFKEVVLGRAEVRAVFKVPKVGNVGGCYITEGKVTRNAGVRLIRDGIVVHEGKIDSLKRFKDDVREVANGFECGIGFERFNDLKEGDIIEAFAMEEIKREAKGTQK